MKRTLLAVGLIFFMSFAASAATVILKVTSAQEIAGYAVVIGKTNPGVAIYWQGAKVAVAATGGLLPGYFSFAAALPLDCTGKLSDGVTTLIVTIKTWNPERECNGFALVPRTGQTATNRDDDDGALQVGVALPTPRFTNNGDGTIKDNLTGLIWLKKANCGLTPAATREGAFQFVDELNRLGTMFNQPCGDTSKAGSHQTDWRLPNIRELGSLIHYGFAQPALSNVAGNAKGSATEPFDDLRGATDGSAGYWSSTSWAGSTIIGWGVNFGATPAPPANIIYLMNTGSTAFGGYAMAVRGGVGY